MGEGQAVRKSDDDSSQEERQVTAEEGAEAAEQQQQLLEEEAGETEGNELREEERSQTKVRGTPWRWDPVRPFSGPS